MQPQRFILQAFDPDYGHPAFETMFVVEHPEELQALLGTAADEDPEIAMVYTNRVGTTISNVCKACCSATKSGRTIGG